MDLEKTLEVVKGFTVQELAIVIMLCVSTLTGGLYIENRYAKIIEVETEVTSIRNDIRRDKEEIFQLNVKTLEILGTFPEEVQEEIIQRAEAYTEMRRRSSSVQ